MTIKSTDLTVDTFEVVKLVVIVVVYLSSCQY